MTRRGILAKNGKFKETKKMYESKYSNNSEGKRSPGEEVRNREGKKKRKYSRTVFKKENTTEVSKGRTKEGQHER